MVVIFCLDVFFKFMYFFWFVDEELVFLVFLNIEDLLFVDFLRFCLFIWFNRDVVVGK